MGNIIELKSSNENDFLRLSNGAMDVLIDILVLAGSKIAKSNSEKNFVLFLGEKQQNIIGQGTVGFEINELPWQRESFENDKKFLLNIIEYARFKTDWKMLGYECPNDILTYMLDGLKRLISKMEINFINDININEWKNLSEVDNIIKQGYPKCKEHDIFLSSFGCKFCNDNKKCK